MVVPNTSPQYKSSYRLLDWAFDQDTDKSIQKLVLIVMCRRGNKHHECYMSYARIAKECSSSIRTVSRAIDELLQQGFIKVLKRPNRFRRTVTYGFCANGPVVGQVGRPRQTKWRNSHGQFDRQNPENPKLNPRRGGEPQAIGELVGFRKLYRGL